MRCPGRMGPRSDSYTLTLIILTQQGAIRKWVSAGNVPCLWPTITLTSYRYFVVSLMTNWSTSEDKPPTEARTEGNELWLWPCCHGHRQHYKHHLGTINWHWHCRKMVDRHDYICSGYNRLYNHKVEGNMNGILNILPPSVNNQLILGLQCH